MDPSAKHADRIAGVILGTAVGDALGLPRENMSRRRGRSTFGRSPMRHRFFLGCGMISDDTEKHGMTLIGFWSPTDQAEAAQKMVYLLAHPSKSAAERSWDAFRKDPEWLKARDASEIGGPIVAKVESVFLNPTDYSAIK